MVWDGKERRHFVRILYPCLIKLTTVEGSDQDAFLTHTQSIGIGGICVIAKKEIPLLTSVEVEMDLLDDAENNFNVAGHVAWIKQREAADPVKPFFYNIGVVFDNIPHIEKIRLEATINQFIQKGYKILKPVY